MAASPPKWGKKVEGVEEVERVEEGVGVEEGEGLKRFKGVAGVERGSEE